MIPSVVNRLYNFEIMHQCTEYSDDEMINSNDSDGGDDIKDDQDDLVC